MRYAITIFLIGIFTIASAEQITLQWDYSAENQARIDGFKLYQTDAGPGNGAYNYSTPAAVIPADARSATVSCDGEQGAVLKYLWVIRAYKGGVESIDSNQADYKVDRVVPGPPVAVDGAYDVDRKSISISWTQPDIVRVSHWMVYYKEPNGDYNELGRVANDGQQKFEFTGPFEIDYSGNIVFYIAAFKRSGVFSADSQGLSLFIDGGPILPPLDLRITIEIPVGR